ncbi:Glycosyltransferase involved in cell wall bisynthesis [Parelusimicrobium proximum]|uniref:glycosyltransferase n=1 Tax=Parelusimicrobium proximum TaxID=3228953 RepID=UPI003D16763D
MKIMIVTPTLAMGGAERVAVHQAKAFSSAGYETSFLTTNEGADYYTLPSSVERFTLKSKGKVAKLSEIIKLLKSHKPDILIIHMSTLAMAAAWAAKIKYIYAEHVDMFATPPNLKKKFLMKRAGSVVTLIPKDAEKLRRQGIKAEVIFNPAACPELTHDLRPPFLKEKNNIVAVARLSRVKGFDMLIEAWSRIDESVRQDWQLTIVGSGEEQDRLEKIIKENTIRGVVLPGHYKNVSAIFKYSDILVLSSRSEAFPMSLCEGMSWGVPAVAFKVTGTETIIRDGIDGILVEKSNVSALSKELANLMTDEKKRKALGEKAKEICQRFSIEKFFSDYLRLIREVLGS